jgi:hypothetical protein
MNQSHGTTKHHQAPPIATKPRQAAPNSTHHTHCTAMHHQAPPEQPNTTKQRQAVPGTIKQQSSAK